MVGVGFSLSRAALQALSWNSGEKSTSQKQKPASKSANKHQPKCPTANPTVKPPQRLRILRTVKTYSKTMFFFCEQAAEFARKFWDMRSFQDIFRKKCAFSKKNPDLSKNWSSVHLVRVKGKICVENTLTSSNTFTTCLMRICLRGLQQPFSCLRWRKTCTETKLSVQLAIPTILSPLKVCRS